MSLRERDGTSQSPLHGAVLCCTSISPERRSVLAEYAEEMGAIHRLDLTSDVTHLVVGAVDTPKYRYVANERPDIKVVLPSWLETVREVWMQAGNAKVEDLEEKCKAPALLGLHVCVTGFDDIRHRSEIQRRVSSNGAQYHGDLTRNITHLIAKEPRGKKYEYAGQWGVKVVTLAWLEASLARGLALDHEKYHPLFKEDASPQTGEKQKSEADVRDVMITRGLKRGSTGGVQPRKLRRTASSKLGLSNEGLWADLKNDTADGDLPLNTEPKRTPKKPESGCAGMDEECTSETKLLGAHQPLMSNAESNMRSGPIMFDGRILGIVLFDDRRAQILRETLVPRGALILTDEDLRRRAKMGASAWAATHSISHASLTFIVSRNISLGSAQFKEFLDSGFAQPEDEIVTEWWVERCIHRDALLEPVALDRQFDGPIEGFRDLIVCPSAFSGIDLLHFSKAIKLLGGTYDETLRPTTDLVVFDEAARSPNSIKVKYALQHSIPIVSSKWLHACVISRRFEPFDSFLHRPDAKDGMRKPDTPPDQHSFRANTSPIPGRATSKLESQSRCGPKKPLHERSPNSTTRSQANGRQAPAAQVSRRGLPRESAHTAIDGALACLLAKRRDKNGFYHDDQLGTSAPRRQKSLGRAASNPSSMSSMVIVTDGKGDARYHEGEEQALVVRNQCEVFRPSQSITYENPEAEIAKESLKRRIGYHEEDECGQRVEKIGIVKHAPEDSARRNIRKR